MSKKEDVKRAMETIKQAMIDDYPSCLGSYAHSWHCNIAMCCYDSMKDWNFQNHGKLTHIESNLIANEAATRFMKLCFDVNTNNDPEDE